MRPTWANSASANATVNARNAASRKAAARMREADTSATPCAAPAAGSRRGGRPTNSSSTGTSSSITVAAATIIAPEKPNWPIAPTSSGTPTMPPQLAPFSARLIAMPRRRSNHIPSVLVMAPRLVPAQPQASSMLTA